MRSLSKRQTLLKLFVSNLYISAFTFGGGFVIVTFMKRKFVDQLQWLEENEMLDMTALAQSSPGAIAVNASILVGWRVAGFWGMVVGVLGTIIPPMVDQMMAAHYRNGIRERWYAQWRHSLEIHSISAREYVRLDPQTRLCAD